MNMIALLLGEQCMKGVVEMTEKDKVPEPQSPERVGTPAQEPTPTTREPKVPIQLPSPRPGTPSTEIRKGDTGGEEYK